MCCEKSAAKNKEEPPSWLFSSDERELVASETKLFPVFQVSRDQLCLFSFTLGRMKIVSDVLSNKSVWFLFGIKHLLAAQTCRSTPRHLANCIEKELSFGSSLSGANTLSWSMSRHSSLVLIQETEAKLYLFSPVNKKKTCTALLFFSSLVVLLCPTLSGCSNDAAVASTGPTDAQEPF